MQERVFEIAGYCDASCGNNPDNGKSTSGYLFITARGPLSFEIALHNVTAQSTVEAPINGTCKQVGGVSIQHDG